MEINGTTYSDDTSPTVAKALEAARVLGDRVHLFYGDPKTGRDWGEENDVVGYVSRSFGPVKVPLLVHNKRSTGGGAILTDSIVKIITTSGRVMYQHPKYHQPQYTIRSHRLDGNPPIGVYAEYTNPKTNTMGHAENVANFGKREQAERWVGFMTGKRGSK